MLLSKKLESVEISDADDIGYPMDLQMATWVIIGKFQILFNKKIKSISNVILQDILSGWINAAYSQDRCLWLPIRCLTIVQRSVDPLKTDS